MILDVIGETPFLGKEIFSFFVEHEEPIEVVTFGNMPHELLISTDDITSFSGPGDATIGVDRLQWRLVTEDLPAEGGWRALSLEDTRVFERNDSGQCVEEIEFRLQLSIQDEVGTYTGDLVFTLASI